MGCMTVLGLEGWNVLVDQVIIEETFNSTPLKLQWVQLGDAGREQTFLGRKSLFRSNTKII